MRPVVALFLGVIVLAAAGCGSSDGSDSSEDTSVSATEAWANDLCGALVTWTDAIRATGDTIRDTSALSVDSFNDAIATAEEATNTLVDEIRALEPPETESGTKAKEAIDEAANALSTDVDELQAALDEAGSSLTALLRQASTIARTLSSMSTTVSKLFGTFSEIDAGGELERAFQDADECQPIVNPS